MHRDSTVLLKRGNYAKNGAGVTMSFMCRHLKENQILTGAKMKIFKNKNHKMYFKKHGVWFFGFFFKESKS